MVCTYHGSMKTAALTSQATAVASAACVATQCSALLPLLLLLGCVQHAQSAHAAHLTATQRISTSRWIQARLSFGSSVTAATLFASSNAKSLHCVAVDCCALALFWAQPPFLPQQTAHKPVNHSSIIINSSSNSPIGVVEVRRVNARLGSRRWGGAVGRCSCACCPGGCVAHGAWLPEGVLAGAAAHRLAVHTCRGTACAVLGT